MEKVQVKDMTTIDSLDMKCGCCDVPMKLINKRYEQLMVKIDRQQLKALLAMLELLEMYGALTPSESHKAFQRLYRRKEDEEQCSNV